MTSERGPGARRRAGRHVDHGMTLVELLVCIAVVGMIVTVIGSAIMMVFRQQADTQARVDVARWEQSLALWLPSDLTSATTVDDDPTAAPCATPTCTFGSNALELEWTDGVTPTVVSYRYGPDPADGGATYVLNRVVCTGGSCSSHTVLRDLAPPRDDDGNPIAWSAGHPVPDDVIDVTVPLAVDASSSSGDTDGASRAQRVIVNVNGAPGGDGVDRSSTVSFTAGGVVRDDLEPATFSGPQFIDARSDCGGPVTLIVDDSGSIGGNIGNVRSGVRSFVEAFEGTPTRLQIIRFDTESSTLGTTGWNRFFDLAEPSDVAALIDGPSALVDTFDAGGGTNWEDALHRAFYTSDGQTYDQLGNPAVPTPELVVFFTDGQPTRDRLYRRTDASSIGPDSVPSRFNHTTERSGGTPGQGYSPRGWYRADYVVDRFRAPDIRMIGVGVGSAFDDDTRVEWSGWPRNSWNYVRIPNEVFLGDLIAGNDPSNYGSGSSGSYVVREYDAGWGDVTAADLLITSDFTQFGSALTQIALAECGGTLTVQTRDGSGQPADAGVTYKIGDEVVTTTRIQKSGTFDVALEDGAPQTIQLVPEPLSGTGYTASGWSCQSGGAPHSYALIAAGDPSQGIELTVSANAAVSCILQVSP